MSGINVAWQLRPFGDLDGAEVHEMIAFRESVFVVEQRCAYQEADTFDLIAQHVFGRSLEHSLIAYARILPPNTKYQQPSIGRIIVAANVRGGKLGNQLLRYCVEFSTEKYPGCDIKLSAQSSAINFYRAEGFEVASEPYDDSGIEHRDMVRLWG